MQEQSISQETSKDTDDVGQLKLDTGGLVEIGQNSIDDDQGTTSEEETPGEDLEADDARTAIGVSISHEQARLTSPKTPAVEKAAAIEKAGGFFGFVDGANDTLVEQPEEHEEAEDHGLASLDGPTEENQSPLAEAVQPSIPERSPRKTELRLPSPWRAEAAADWQKSIRGKSGLLDGLFNRRRAGSTPESTTEGWQKSLLSSLPSLPSLPKHFSIASPFSKPEDARSTPETQSSRRAKATSVQLPYVENGRDFSPTAASSRQRSESDGRMQDTVRQPSISYADGTKVGGIDLHSPSPLHPLHSGPRMLRRSTSDGSLVTQRTLSRVESLGDDRRFEHIQDQVNSRFKAIKDSWQDANIRLPSMPNFNMSNFAPEFLRDRSGSLNKRLSVQQSIQTTAGAARDFAQPAASGLAQVQSAQTTSKPLPADAAIAKLALTHPNFHRALEQLEGDVVILGGYRGSILRSAEPPHRQLWVPVKVGLNLRKANLELGLEEDEDEQAIKKIIPGGMLTHIGPVDIARRLFKRLRSSKNARDGKLRVHDWGYDWRLMPSYLSKTLITFLETLPCNQPGVSKESRGATVIAHSLGGLITRHAVNQRPELFRGIVYAGVPNTCVNILGPMRNGDDVLLSSRVLTAQVNFTIRTSFALLPLDGRCFFNKRTGEEYPVDFFDATTWTDLRLSPCVGRPLPRPDVQSKPSGLTGYVSSLAGSLPSLPLPGRRSSVRISNLADPSKATTIANTTEPDSMKSNDANITAPDDAETDSTGLSTSVGTVVTIPRDKALAYLERTLASVKQFKQDLAFHPAHAESNLYPPVAVIYGKSTPTVYGAKVDSREAIKRADAYDELAFASGDGVVLARAAMAPQGYTIARGGVVASQRGHVTLLGDLEAVGKCLNAIIRATRKGVGLGVETT